MLIESQLPVLIVITPLVAGLVTPWLMRNPLPWAWASLATTATFVMAIAMLAQVLETGVGFVSYELGGWRPPWGIEYRVDAVNGLVLVVVSGVAAVVTLFARRSVASEIPQNRSHFFYCVWLMCVTGLLGITITGDAFNLYVLLEISALAAYTLIAMGMYRDRRALTASINYLVLGTIGASFILLGIGYLYMLTGTLNMADMGERLRAVMAENPGNKTVIVAAGFLFTGFAIKIALFPLHTWLPNAYCNAPSAVSALLAATATKVAAYAMIRFLFTIFGADIAFKALPLDLMLVVAASVAILVGSIVAIRQTNLKRLLAYSSVAQIGYIVLGVGLANQLALTGALIHIFNHALMKGGMFLAAGALAFRLGGTKLADLQGMGRRMPFTMAAFTVGGLGLVGVPLTAGFISKWYLVSGAMEDDRWVSAVVILVGSLLALIYVGKVVEIAYFKPPRDACAATKEAPLSLVIPAWLLIGASVFFGCNAEWSAGVAEQAARLLMSTGEAIGPLTAAGGGGAP